MDFDDMVAENMTFAENDFMEWAHRHSHHLHYEVGDNEFEGLFPLKKKQREGEAANARKLVPT